MCNFKPDSNHSPSSRVEDTCILTATHMMECSKYTLIKDTDHNTATPYPYVRRSNSGVASVVHLLINIHYEYP